ncbi:MAG: MBL fold metallo-hydrolase [Myxococcota bacterium]
MDRPMYYDEPFRAFEYNGGVHLTDSVLWCDTDRRNDLVFISHSHADYVGKHRRILATDKTVRVLTRGTGKIDALTSPYRRKFTLGPLSLQMYPSGHVLGAAQLLIVRDDQRLLYTSDINPRESLTAEQSEVVPCDVLVIPATYGRPQFKFPPREEVIARLSKRVDDCLSDKTTPVLIANPIGLAQELMQIFGTAGHRLRVHRSIYDVAKIYRELGVSLPNARRFQGVPAKDEIVIFPPILRNHTSIRKLKKHRTIMVDGRALDDAYVFASKVDEAFALSDTAGYDELLAFIKQTGAAEVFLSDGYIDEFAQDLRDAGIRAFPLVKPKQLSLF